MIKITIEMIPGGLTNHPRRRVMHEIFITNVGGSHCRGDYKVEAVTCGVDGRTRKFRSGHVYGFPRQSKNVVHLLYRALRELVGKDNPE